MICSLVDTSKIPCDGIYCIGTPFERLAILSITPPEPVLKPTLYVSESYLGKENSR